MAKLVLKQSVKAHGPLVGIYMYVSKFYNNVRNTWESCQIYGPRERNLLFSVLLVESFLCLLWHVSMTDCHIYFFFQNLYRWWLLSEPGASNHYSILLNASLLFSVSSHPRLSHVSLLNIDTPMVVFPIGMLLRCNTLQGITFPPGPEFSKILKFWLTSGMIEH